MKKWKIDEAEYSPLAVIEDTEDGYGVAEIGLNGERTPENIANAYLIAAAPELMEALKELQKQIFAHHKMNTKKDFSLLVADAAAGKAIFKAEGGLK